MMCRDGHFYQQIGQAFESALSCITCLQNPCSLEIGVGSVKITRSCYLKTITSYHKLFAQFLHLLQGQLPIRATISICLSGLPNKL